MTLYFDVIIPSLAWSSSSGETLVGKSNRVKRIGQSPEVKRLVNPTECWQGCNGWAVLGGTAERNGLLKIVKRGKGKFSLLRFSGIGCGKGCLSCGVIQKGRFCPCGE